MKYSQAPLTEEVAIGNSTTQHHHYALFSIKALTQLYSFTFTIFIECGHDFSSCSGALKLCFTAFASPGQNFLIPNQALPCTGATSGLWVM